MVGSLKMPTTRKKALKEAEKRVQAADLDLAAMGACIQEGETACDRLLQQVNERKRKSADEVTQLESEINNPVAKTVKQGSHIWLNAELFFGSSWWFMSWFVVICSDLWWFMSWFVVVYVMVHGSLCHGLWWFVVICGDLCHGSWWFMSWFVVICSDLWWLMS